MLQNVKLALRISHSALDLEITDLIEAARHDLMLSGISSVKANDISDPLIKRAITVYVKANFGYDAGEKDRVTSINRYQEAYNMLKQHLSMSGDYHV